MELIVATHNKGKLREFGRILEPLGIRVRSEEEVCPGLEVEETGTTFAQNAYLKAKALYDATGLATVADDSGLCVDALGGAPGVYSARYAGENATDAQRVEKLLGEVDSQMYVNKAQNLADDDVSHPVPSGGYIGGGQA